MWYVVQVPTAREEFMCHLIRRVAEGVAQREQAEAEARPGCEAAGGNNPEAKAYLQECFVPTCEFERKRRGEWQRLRRPLFPGYVVADTQDVAALTRLLWSVPEFTRVLRMGESFVPLDAGERNLIETYADPESRCVHMSVAVMEGDEVRVVSGPLMGHEGQIREVNRRAGTALLEVRMFGRTTTAKVGLAIVAKRGKENSG